MTTEKEWTWGPTLQAYLDAEPGAVGPAPIWGRFDQPENAHAAAQAKNWDFGEYIVADREGNVVPPITQLLAVAQAAKRFCVGVADYADDTDSAAFDALVDAVTALESPEPSALGGQQ